MPPPPTLPDLPSNAPVNCQLAYENLTSAYMHIIDVLAQEQYDNPRLLRILADEFNAKAATLGILQAAGIPTGWIQECAHACSGLVNALHVAINTAEGSYVQTFCINLSLCLQIYLGVLLIGFILMLWRLLLPLGEGDVQGRC